MTAAWENTRILVEVDLGINLGQDKVDHTFFDLRTGALLTELARRAHFSTN